MPIVDYARARKAARERPGGPQVIRANPALRPKVTPISRLQGLEYSRGEFRDEQGRAVRFKKSDPAGALAEGLLRGLDLITGIPTAIRDPSVLSIGLAAGAVTPIGRIARAATAGARLAQGTTRTVRRIPVEGRTAVKIPAAQSRFGQAAEQLYDIAQGRLAPEFQRRRALRELAFQSQREGRIARGEIEGLQREVGFEDLSKLPGLTAAQAEQVARIPQRSLGTAYERSVARNFYESALAGVGKAKPAEGLVTLRIGRVKRYVEPEVADDIIRLERKFRIHDTHLTELAQGKTPGRRIGVGLVDLVNDVQRIAVITLNAPAYVANNLPSNLLLNLVHEGWSAPSSLIRSVLLYRRLDPSRRNAMRAMAGSGITRAVEQGLEESRRLLDLPGLRQLQSGIQNVTDLFPRLAALTYEMRAEGFDTVAKVSKLLSNPKLAGKRALIGQRANDAMVSFDRLTPFEREIVSRVVFFFPWVKGASRYTGRAVLEHPVKTAAIGAAGYGLYKQKQEELGQGPFYTRYLLPVGRDRAINPARLHPALATAENLEALANVLTGREAGPQLSEAFGPGVSIAAKGITGRGRYGQRLSIPQIVAEEFRYLPQERFIRNIVMGEPKEGIFPAGSRLEALAQLAGGSTLFPRLYDPEEAAERVKTSAQRAQEKREHRLARIAQATGKPVEPWVGEVMTIHERVNAEAEKIRKLNEQVLDRLPGDTARGRRLRDRLRLLAEINVLASIDPKAAQSVRESYKLQKNRPDGVNSLTRWVERRLGFHRLEELEAWSENKLAR